jgi:outer membrane protein TolC
MNHSWHRLERVRTVFFALALLVASPLASAQTGELLTLRDAVNAALVYSPQLKGANEKLVQAKAQLWQAYGMLLPFVSVQGTYTRADEKIALNFGSFDDLFRLAGANCFSWDTALMGPKPGFCDTVENPPPVTEADGDGGGGTVIQELNNWDASLTVGMSLLNARTLPLIKNVYTGEELAKLQSEFAQEQLIFAVVQTYYGASTARNAVELMRDNLATAMRHLDFVEVRRANGVALENERIRAAISVLQARNGLDQATAGLELAQASLGLLIGRDGNDFQVEATPRHPWSEVGVDATDEGHIARRTDVKMMDKMTLMAERGVTDIWMKFVPTLQGVWAYSASSNTGFAGRNTQWRAMITLNWNLLEGGMRFAELDIARSKVREAQYNKDAALLGARTQLTQAVSGIRTAQTDLATAEEMSRLAQENLALVEKQYKHGVAQQTVMLDAEQQVRSARIQTLQGQLRLALAQVSLAKAAGLVGKEAFVD